MRSFAHMLTKRYMSGVCFYPCYQHQKYSNQSFPMVSCRRGGYRPCWDDPTYSSTLVSLLWYTESDYSSLERRE